MKSILFISTLLVLSGFYGFAQPVAADQNKPVPATAPTPVNIPYPGLFNYGNMSLRNFMRSFQPQKPTANAADVSLANVNNGSNTMPVMTAYTDGLGRTLQTVVRRGATGVKDLSTVRTYDALGRERIRYLPFNSDFTQGADGTLNQQPLSRLSQVYSSAYPYEHPYSEVIYDNSPLNIVKKQMAPGKNWVGSSRGVLYERRAGLEYVIKWAVVSGEPVFAGFYPDGSLSVLKTTDEDGHIRYDYKDKQGRLILTRQLTANTEPASFHPDNYAHTYHVYDDMGLLQWIITPEAFKQSTNTNWQTSFDVSGALQGLCYGFTYDDQKRVATKKVPGKEVEEYVYDKRSRLAFARDGNLTAAGKWSFVIYDRQDRPMMTGLFSNTLTPGQLDKLLNGTVIPAAGTLLSYMRNLNLYLDYPASLSDAEILTYTYYDSYDFPDLAPFSYNTAINAKLTGQAPYAISPVQSRQTRGLVTGQKIRVMDPAASVHWLTSIFYYDDKQQLIQTAGSNIKGDVDVTAHQYEFDGSLISTVTLHHNSAAISPASAYPNLHKTTEVVIRYVKDYHKGVITGSEMNINNTGWRKITATTTDDFGRLATKTLGNDFINQYTYNVKGWLTGINPQYLDGSTGASGPFFGESLSYDNGFGSKLYNGNIAGIVWKGAGAGSMKRFYGYTYDALNRLTHAEFGQRKTLGGPGFGFWDKTDVDYTVSNLSYDYNGNIKSMNQRGPGYLNNNLSAPGMVDMDLLEYDYAPGSNQLLKVTDKNNGQLTNAPDFKDGNVGSSDYSYDPNGNLLTDKNKYIYNNILYNYLNQPEQIEVYNKGSVRYVYDAAGNRLQKTAIPVNGPAERYDYIGGFVYRNDLLQYIVHPDGRCRPLQSSSDGLARFDYDFFVKDHLGNVRSVVFAQASGLGPLLNPTEYTASLEVALANTENLLWDYVDEVRVDKPEGEPGDTKAARLDGTQAEKRIGTAIMLRVMPGDKFKVGANTYWEGNADNRDDVDAEMVASSLLSTLAGGATYSGVPISEIPDRAKLVEGAFNNSDFAQAWQSLHDVSYDDHSPDAGLTYMVLDENLKMVWDQSGVLQVGKNAGAWNRIGLSEPVEIGQAGYLVVFLGSKSHTPVYGDNVSLVFYKGVVLEEDHYYPFGLTLTLGTANPNEKNHYKLTGKELQSECDLNFYDYGPRHYDMQTGRWNSPDLHSDRYASHSPYAFNFNNPIRFIDPSGMDPFDPDFYRYTDNQGTTHTVSLLGTTTPTAQVDGYTAINIGNTVTFADKFGNIQTASEVIVKGERRLDVTMAGGGITRDGIHDTYNASYYPSTDLRYTMAAYGAIALPILPYIAGEAYLALGTSTMITAGTGAAGGTEVIALEVQEMQKEATVVEAEVVQGLTKATEGGYSTIYRAVSQAEVDDIAEFGFRMKAGGYESGKLFAPTLQEATQFGKYNFGLDGIPNTIMKVRIPNNVLDGAIKFGADGMNAISVPTNQLNLLQGTPLNYSPLIR